MRRAHSFAVLPLAQAVTPPLAFARARAGLLLRILEHGPATLRHLLFLQWEADAERSWMGLLRQDIQHVALYCPAAGLLLAESSPVRALIAAIKRIAPGGEDRYLLLSVFVSKTFKIGTLSRPHPGLRDLFRLPSLRRSYLLRVLSATPDLRYVSIEVPTSRGGTKSPARLGFSHFIPPALCASATIIPLRACNGTSRDPLPVSAGHAC